MPHAQVTWSFTVAPTQQLFVARRSGNDASWLQHPMPQRSQRVVIFETNQSAQNMEEENTSNPEPAAPNKHVEIVGISDRMKERLMKEAATCSNPYHGTTSRRPKRQKFTQVYILAGAALIVLIGGHGILF